MASFQILLIILVFLAMALSMFFRKIPALLALPLMAFLIPLIAGVDLNDTLQLVIGQGATRLSTAYTVALFGSMLSVLLQKTGVAESMIKKGAELSGDNPWFIAVFFLILITLLFTTLGGLGAIIMVATIVLPILSSVGLGSMTVVGVFLIGLSMGGILNAGNWAVYVDVMGLDVASIRPFALTMFAITFTGALVYITVQLYRDGHSANILRLVRNVAGVLLFLAILWGVWQLLPANVQAALTTGLEWIGWLFKLLILGGLAVLVLFNLYRGIIRSKFGVPSILPAASAGSDDKLGVTLRRDKAHQGNESPATVKVSTGKRATSHDVHWSAYLTPIVPLVLILVFSMNFIAAFIIGLIYGYVATYRKGHLNLLIRAILDGGAMVMPAVVLMLGIGMLLNAIIGPGGGWNAAHPEGWAVLNLLQPVMERVVPTNAFVYVLAFSLAAPLALYRGPLNVWGMGYGLAAVFLAAGMEAGAIMGLLMAVGQIQGVSDPTNTHNVWLANEMQQDVQKVLWNTLPYTWVIACLGLIAAAIMFM